MRKREIYTLLRKAMEKQGTALRPDELDIKEVMVFGERPEQHFRLHAIGGRYDGVNAYMPELKDGLYLWKRLLLKDVQASSGRRVMTAIGRAYSAMSLRPSVLSGHARMYGDGKASIMITLDCRVPVAGLAPEVVRENIGRTLSALASDMETLDERMVRAAEDGWPDNGPSPEVDSEGLPIKKYITAKCGNSTEFKTWEIDAWKEKK